MLTIIFLFFAIFLYWHLIHKRRRYPKGPTPLPFVGNALTLKKYHGDLDQIFIKWKEEFGDVYTVWIGETPFVMVNSYKKIIELFQNDDGRFSGRFSFDEKEDLMRGGHVAGILHTENQLWQEQRRFVLRVFRDFGLGKNLRVLNEVSDLISIVNKDIDAGIQEHNMPEHIEAKVGSVINSILFNYRFDHQTQGCAKKLIDFFQAQISEHKAKCDLESDEPPSDFVEAYLRKQHKEGNPNYNTVLSWMLIYLIENPEVQKRMHSELDRIGSDRVITMADRTQLPYCNAVVYEGLRLANILVVNVMHKLLQDTEIDGHVVPKGTCILPQISTVLYDKNIFEDPKAFKPERFLDENGNLKTINEFVPFSVGKRQCLGEGIARMELWIFTANIVNNFEIFAGKTKPSNQRHMGGTIHPHGFTCGVRRRTHAT